MKLLPYFISIFFIISCNSKIKKQESVENIIGVAENTLDKVESFAYWHADFDTISKSDCIIKGKSLDLTPKKIETLIDILNTRPSECKIQLLKTSEDTVFIKIIKDYYLTQQMGTTGAWTWLAETTFTLTEIQKIENVNIDFEFGDHAEPGNYNRQTFNDLKIIK